MREPVYTKTEVSVGGFLLLMLGMVLGLLAPLHTSHSRIITSDTYKEMKATLVRENQRLQDELFAKSQGYHFSWTSLAKKLGADLDVENARIFLGNVCKERETKLDNKEVCLVMDIDGRPQMVVVKR